MVNQTKQRGGMPGLSEKVTKKDFDAFKKEMEDRTLYNNELTKQVFTGEAGIYQGAVQTAAKYVRGDGHREVWDWPRIGKSRDQEHQEARDGPSGGKRKSRKAGGKKSRKTRGGQGHYMESYESKPKSPTATKEDIEKLTAIVKEQCISSKERKAEAAPSSSGGKRKSRKTRGNKSRKNRRRTTRRR